MRLQPNHKRILEATLFLIQQGEKKSRPVTQYEIVKSLFLADVAHLERYGRPVTFDNYHALAFGPVPEAAYDMLKPDYVPSPYPNEAWPPWRREPAGKKAFFHPKPEREPNVRALSRSDVTALSAALDEVRALGFGGVKDKTHENASYKEAWARRGTKKAAPMNYARVMSKPDEVLAADLAEASRYA